MEKAFEGDAAKYQELLCRLPGVFSASVVLDEAGQPAEIHLLSSDGRTPKAITRDVQSALMAAFHLPVDYRIISIACVRPHMVEHPFRLRYGGIEISFDQSRGEVTVRLCARGEQYLGKGSCSSHRPSRSRAAAEATLKAVCAFAQDREYELLFAQTVNCAGKDVALVGLFDRDGKQLVGSAFVEEDADSAFVKATLDAVNRQLAYAPGA